MHTQAEKWTYGPGLEEDEFYDITDASGHSVVAQIPENTAARITHCVNTHDQLVEALERIIDRNDKTHQDGRIDWIAAEALSQAIGE